MARAPRTPGPALLFDTPAPEIAPDRAFDDRRARVAAATAERYTGGPRATVAGRRHPDIAIAAEVFGWPHQKFLGAVAARARRV